MMMLLIGLARVSRRETDVPALGGHPAL